MNYIVEKYSDFKRFNEQYDKIYRFLLETADKGYNEHFNWGRFEWMMCHTQLDIENLDKIAFFKDEEQKIVGMVTYDTKITDSTYLIHSIDDESLLLEMLDFALHNYVDEGKVYIAANTKDVMLCKVLAENGFEKKHDGGSVIQLCLDNSLDYRIPEGYQISTSEFVSDNWKYQMVIHRGFNHEDIPQKWDDELFLPTPNFNSVLKVFALDGEEYCAHCGVWYTEGETAYIEPVVTVPECRNKGLAKAVVYEAVKRAKNLGAKRAVVLSRQPFYFKIGFEMSTDIFYWEKAIG